VTSGPSPTVAHLLRDLSPRVLGALVRRYGDFASAEDVMQEALIAATEQWPRTGLPDNPSGWLYRVACRRMTDQRRSEQSRKAREITAHEEIAPTDPTDQDDTLVLLFMCCHPALTPASAIALTLRAVGGLTTAEIARAFLVPEATMAQRISRAKQTIQTSAVPFELPDVAEQRERLSTVLHVLYLIFNEGYTSTGGAQLQRVELSAEAIRLTRALHRVLPDDAEVAGLLALLLLTDARRGARSGPNDELIPLDAQDRSLWDRAAIEEGVALLTATLPRGAIGPYQLQAAIAACHDEAARAEETDWPQILALYSLLERMSDNPMVTLNRAVALAMVQGPGAGLALLKPLERDERMVRNHRLDAVRAHLHEMSGDREEAIALYRRAAERTTSLPERNYLLGKAASMSDRIGR
jgi:RNA polymerase sigma factor (sigma-70 family)